MNFFTGKSLLRLFLSLLILFISINKDIDSLFAKQTKPIAKKNKKIANKKKESKIPKKEKEIDEAKKKDDKEKERTKKIIEILDFGIQKERKEAVIRIPLIKNKKLQSKLVDKLIDIIEHDSNTGVKKKAIFVIGEIKAKKAIPVIIKTINDESESIRIETIYTLKKLNAISAKNKLIEKLKAAKLDEDSNYTEALLNILGEFKAVELTEYAIDSIKNSETTKILREYFVLFLGNIGSKKSKDFLLELYKDEEENRTIRAYAINAISKLGIKEATSDIKDVLKQIDSYSFKKKKRYYSLSIYSITALVKLGDSEALPRLIDSLKSDNMTIRLRAIKLLKDLKDKRTIDILKYKIKYDPSVRVQKAAKEALKEMGIDVDKKEEDLKNKKNQKEKNNPEKFNNKKKIIKKSKNIKK